MATSNNPREVLAALGRQRDVHPELNAHIELHRAILATLSEVPVKAPAARSRAGVAEAMEAGRPLLRPKAVAIEWDVFRTTYVSVCDVITEHRPDLEGDLMPRRAVAGNGHGRLQEEVRAYLVGDRPGGDAPFAPSGRTDVARFLVGSAVRPFLWAYADVLAPLVEDRQWYRGRCPVCGGEPDLAALTAGDAPSGPVETGQGHRRLLCSRCDTEWLYRRIGCPFCGTRDHRKIAYYTDDAETHRLYVCEACRRYLKAVDQRERWQTLPLPVERVLTVGMDVAAVNAGYGFGPE